MFLFLDEVTYKEHCMQEMKNLFDFGSAKVFASSSSATMLKRDTGFLTGRSRTVEVEALDFEEFLLFKGLNPRGLEKYLIEKYFLKYMELGGIPEYVLTEEAEVVIDLLSTIISKDIISFLGVKKREVIYDLFRLLCERVGKQISYNKLAKILGIHKDTVKEYVGYFVDTYLFYIAQKKGKLNERLLGSNKLYCADVGIKNVSTGFRDLGAIYENLVFLKIRKEKPFFVKKGAVEIDFWYKDNLIEAKFGQKLEGKQKEVFESFRVKKRTLAEDYKFFLDE